MAARINTDGFPTVVFFIFFQAEDGIRDDLVTGVQTCALPILRVTALLSREKQSLKTKKIFPLRISACFGREFSTVAEGRKSTPQSDPTARFRHDSGIGLLFSDHFAASLFPFWPIAKCQPFPACRGLPYAHPAKSADGSTNLKKVN